MKKKGIIITIIVILAVLIVAGGIFAYIFFCTDLLLSEKQGFGKYVMQLGDKEEGFITNSVNTYFSNKEATTYTTNGKISANVAILKDISTDYELQTYNRVVEAGNNTNITFTGKVDNRNNRIEQDISVNYSDTVKLPFTFKRYGDIYGVQADSISETYLAIENNNLQEFAQKFEIVGIEDIPNKIETPNELKSLNLTQEEKTHIQTEYILPIYNNLAEEKFSKTENADGSVTYTLTLTSAEIKQIYINLLETLRRDQTMIDKINEAMEELYDNGYNESYVMNSEDIQSEIDYVQVQEWGNETVKINVTQNDRKTNKVNIEYEDIAFNIEKEEVENAVSYRISETDTANGEEISLTVNLSGLNTNSVTESYEMNVKYENEYDITYAYENTVSFGNVNIEPITTANAAILNNYSAQQIIPLITEIGTRIAQINAEQMTAIGYNMQYGNPLLTWIATPSYISYISTSSLLDSLEQTQQEYEDALQEEQEKVDEIETYVNNMIADQNSETVVNPNDILGL